VLRTGRGEWGTPSMTQLAATPWEQGRIWVDGNCSAISSARWPYRPWCGSTLEGLLVGTAGR
jgi:hypothetical protein